MDVPLVIGFSSSNTRKVQLPIEGREQLSMLILLFRLMLNSKYVSTSLVDGMHFKQCPFGEIKRYRVSSHCHDKKNNYRVYEKYNTGII